MKSNRHIGKTLAFCVALAAIGSPVSASTLLTFPMTTNGTGGTSGQVFNVTVGTITVKVRVTAWTTAGTSSSSAVTKGGVNVYSNGLGVSSVNELGGSPHHTIDNLTNKDFLIFQFDQPVELESAKFTTYNMGSTRTDGDATIAYGTAGNWLTDLMAPTATYGQLSTLFGNSFQASSVGSTNGQSSLPRSLNLGNKTGNIWLIGAAFINPSEDCKSGSKKNQPCLDGFKLSQLSVQSAVPEPATWMMMLIGFGFAGFAMRRKSRALKLANA